MKSIFKSIIIKLLFWETRFILKKYEPKIIAISGSVGKTTTKDAVAAVLSSKFNIRKSKKSYNSEFGVPLTVIGKPNPWENIFGWLDVLFSGFHLLIFRADYPRVLVLEAGVSLPGDMNHLTAMFRPDLVVMTGMGEIPVHVEFFGTPEALWQEKKLIFKNFKPGGTAILNIDSPQVAALKEELAGHHILTYGFSSKAEVSASQFHITYSVDSSLPSGVSFHLAYQGKSFPLRLSGVLGKTSVYASLAAFAVGASLGVSLLEIIQALEKLSGPPGRQKIMPGIKSSIIIDDSYNSSPIALEAVLEVFNELKTKRKILVLGDMAELGKFSVEAHENAGHLASKIAGYLVLVGSKNHFIKDGAIKAGFSDEKISSFNDSREAGKFLQNFIEPGDTILVKGSQSVRLERVVEEIMADPARKKELLVRQEDEWQKR